MAVFLDWLATGSTYKSLARTYDISPAIISRIIRSSVYHFRQTAVKDALKLPKGAELQHVMQEFELLCHLPGVCGALDGTFIEISKPVANGHLYWCYKHIHAITLLAVVDHAGCFSYANAGKYGSSGDAAVWAASKLRRRLFQGTVYNAPPVMVDGYPVQPYLVADAAFALHPRVMKCFNARPAMLLREKSFNFCLIRTRRVVEQAFGRLKGRFRVLTVGALNYRDPYFIEKVALVCCALHNILERRQCAWDPNLASAGQQGGALTGGGAGGAAAGGAAAVRSALSVHAVRKVGHYIE
jgi:hypothetical protein